MKIFIYLLLCLSVVTSNVYARRAVKNFDRLRDATREMFKIPEIIENIAWGKSGVAIDELIAYLHEHKTELFMLYNTERGLRIQLGKAIVEEMQGDVFALQIREGDKKVRKYFRGEEPNLKVIIAEIIANDEFNAKMQWGSEGLSMDDIMAEVIKHYPDVHKLYVGYSPNSNEYGLRTALGMVLDTEMQSDVFKLGIRKGGKHVLKYFRGEEPDLKAIVAEIIAKDVFNAKMQLGKEGLSMDDIMAEVIKHHPDVYKLYVKASHNSNEYGLRAALGKVLEKGVRGDVFTLLIGEGDKQVLKYFRGEEPDLKAIVAEIIANDVFSAKMQLGKEGLSMDDIMAEIKRQHADVHKLYVGASHNSNEYGLRSALGRVLDTEMQGDVFKTKITEGRNSTSKYFRGEEPDLKAIVAEIIANDVFSAKMQLGKEGLSMDDIIAEVIKQHSDVHKLYVGASHNNNEKGLRIALGLVMNSIDEVVSHEQIYFWKKKR